MKFKKQINGKEALLLSMIALSLGIMIGFISGMVFQQYVFIDSAVRVAEGLEGTTFNIEIDLNETLLVDSTYRNLEERGFLDFNITGNESKST